MCNEHIFCFKMNALLIHGVFPFHVAVYNNIIRDYSLLLIVMNTNVEATQRETIAVIFEIELN